MQLLKEKRRKIPSVIVRVLAVMYCLAVMVVGVAEYTVPDSVTVTKEEIGTVSANASGVNTKLSVEAKLFGVVPTQSLCRAEMYSELNFSPKV